MDGWALRSMGLTPLLRLFIGLESLQNRCNALGRVVPANNLNHSCKYSIWADIPSDACNSSTDADDVLMLMMC